MRLAYLVRYLEADRWIGTDQIVVEGRDHSQVEESGRGDHVL